jgi:hypothetical protein
MYIRWSAMRHARYWAFAFSVLLGKTAFSASLPSVTTGAVTQITTTGARVEGTVTADGGAAVTARGYVFGTSPGPSVTTVTPYNDGSGLGTFASVLTLAPLQPGTRYYLRAFATNSVGTAYGAEVNFITLGGTAATLPSVTTAAVNSITATSAAFGGNVTNDGGAAVSQRGVVYGTAANPTTSSNSGAITSGGGTGAYSGSSTTLTPNTLYYVRAYATNSVGTAYSNQASFTTLGTPVVNLPIVTTGAVTQITSTSARVEGTVVSDGGGAVTTRGYPIRTLVAFSGEVNDKESGPEEFSEKTLNPGLKGRDIREAFKGSEYQILLVANKFQTGFDQPLLCGMYVDKRLAGIQAVQTLSRLNRAHPGKDTTYVLDFVNDAAEILAAFKTYHATAELAATTDPNLVFNLRAKLDAAGHFDEFEVERVVVADITPGSTQCELLKAIEPVVDRLLRRYKAAQEALRVAREKGDEERAKKSQDELNALILFKGDVGAYIRLYTFLSQIFDYGNTAIERRAIFFKRLLPLLEFGREREGIDLSKVTLTHHNIRNVGRRVMHLNEGEAPKLEPITEAGSGSVQAKQRALLNEIIEKVNVLFEGELTDQDKLVYVNNVIKGKLLESVTLQKQAASNTKEQFANSPDLNTELLNAIMGALDAHTAMSTQALNSTAVQRGLKDILLNYSQLWETLRAKAAG